MTFKIALGSTLLILPFGIAVALGLARWRWPGKSLVETALSLPLVLPPTAVGLLLLELFGRQGPLGRLLAWLHVEVIFTPVGAVLAAAIMSFPLLVRPIRTALESIDPRLFGIARTLGCGRLTAFWRVTLPLAARGIVTGALLAFCRALGEFGATMLVAGNIPGRTQTLALAIFQRVELGHDAAALRLVAVTALLSFAVLFTTELVTARQRRRRGE